MLTLLITSSVALAVVGFTLIVIAVSMTREIARVIRRSDDARAFGVIARDDDYIIRL